MILYSFLIILFGFAACEESSSKAPIAQRSVENSTKQLMIQETDSAAVSCLQVCGLEARETVYSDCIGSGVDRQDCGISAREWYRECLENRCDETAIEIDNCRTSCRLDVKEEKQFCNSAEDKQSCLEEVRSSIRSCIDTCQ